MDAHRRRLLRHALAVVALLLPARAGAQVLDRPATVRFGPVAVGGDVSLVVGPQDSTAFFNYTDYEQNALRGARVRP